MFRLLHSFILDKHFFSSNWLTKQTKIIYNHYKYNDHSDELNKIF